MTQRTQRFDWERALLASDLPASARLIGLTLATRTDPDLTIPADFTPSLSTIAKWTGLSRRAVQLHLNGLETAGWVTRSRPTVMAARVHHERTRYGLATPAGAGAPDALGHEIPQPGEPSALGLGNEVHGARAPVALNHHVPSPSPSPSITDVAVAASPGFRDLTEDEIQPFIEFHKIRRWRPWLKKAMGEGFYEDSIREFRGARNQPAATSDRKLMQHMNVVAELEQYEERQLPYQSSHETKLLGA
ncbi:helix-turn-helix domain-containing protein [Georgenia yuyongxinii]|uniref:helix-turn-helix domain-containing protein n=1 Tax=Georgenia yuyongxinii TaxID=2589797 RepID=UPI00143DFA6D|nr:helix-turn-helix domain-containing protein [Georgenia yuyongxinii]